MILKNLCESDLYDAIFTETEEEIVAYDIMALHTDIVFNDKVYNLRIDHDPDNHMFRVIGDMTTEWIDPYTLRGLLSCCDNDLYGLPGEGTEVIAYSGKLYDDLVDMEDRYE